MDDQELVINPLAVCTHFLQLLKQLYQDFDTSEPTHEEILLAKTLLDRSWTCFRTPKYRKITNCFWKLDDSQASSETSRTNSSQESYFDDDGEEIFPDNADVPLERKKEILKLINEHPNWSLGTIRRHGALEFKDMRYKSRWQAQVDSGGTLFEKYKSIDEYTWEMFLHARQAYHSIHTNNLCSWALQKSQTFKDLNFRFKASPTWVHKFKNRHGIRSRRITKVVSRREIKSSDAINKTVQKFREEFKEKSRFFTASSVLNTDQAGFNYEIVSKRTLSLVGEKTTFAVAKSPKNLATHSYTVQYVISLAGDVIGNLFLCLQETSGRLGPIVEEKIFPAQNVTVTCSKSWKLTSEHVEFFLQKVLKPAVNEDFLYVLYCWTGQIDQQLYQDTFDEDISCVTLFVPEKTTSICQPLDTIFHLQLKYFTKQITTYAALQTLHPTDEITTRDNVIRMQSLMHHQFKAEIFRPMIKYCWVTSGLAEKVGDFLSVKEACFTFQESDSRMCHIPHINCENERFIKCAHCRNILCYDCVSSSNIMVLLTLASRPLLIAWFI